MRFQARIGLAVFLAGCARPAPQVRAPVTDASPPAQAADPETSAAFSDQEQDDDNSGYGYDRERVPLDPATAYVLKPDTVIMLERSACSDNCPSYSVGLTADGSVHFYGVRTVSAGYQTASIGRAPVEALLSFIATKQLHTFHARYLALKANQPNAVVTLRQGAAGKRVFHDQSNRSVTALTVIEDEIDRVTKTSRWVGSFANTPGPPGAPAIPVAAMVQMLGDQVHAVERTCGATVGGGKVPFTLPVSIDALGYGRLSNTELPHHHDRVRDCVEQEVPKLLFPIVKVGAGTDLTFVLGH